MKTNTIAITILLFLTGFVAITVCTRPKTSSLNVGLDVSSPASSPKLLLYSQPQPIRVLQKTLIDLGYDCGENAPDGVVGAKTMAAWKAWDRENAGFVLDYYEN